MRRAFNNNTSTMDKSWDTFAFVGLFSVYICPTHLQFHKHRWTRVSRIFRFLTLCRVGVGRIARKLRKGELFYEGTKKLQKIINNAFMSQGLLSRIVVLRQAVRRMNLFNGIETISILII